MDRKAAVFILLTMIFSLAAAGEPSVATKPAAIKPTLHLPGVWIKGTILWMIVDFHNEGPQQQFLWIVRGEPVFSRDLYGVDLTDEATQKVVASRDFPSIHTRGIANSMHGPSPVYHPTMAANAILSVPMRLNWTDPPVGKYQMRFRWQGQTATAQIEIREPTAAEAPFIQNGNKMWQYPFDKKAKDLPADAPQSIRAAVGLDSLLHNLFTTHKEASVTYPTDPAELRQFDDTRAMSMSQISQFDAAGLGKDLPEFYQPIVSVLRYEILFDQDHIKESEELKSQLLKAHPGFEWMLYRGIPESPTIAQGRDSTL